jgi:glycosyltransferase involved in cell wall biosynthesis
MFVRRDRLRVLLVVEECNPEIASVPSEGFHLARALSAVADVTLVTHGRNRIALGRAMDTSSTVFVPESRTLRWYTRLASRLAVRGREINWPLLTALSYPSHCYFDRSVFRRLARTVAAGEYDLVHAFTPVMPRFPFSIVNACRATPFILGPVNGGLPYPPGFRDIARREHDYFDLLRSASRYLPGYRATYQGAQRVLVGSSYTLAMLRRTLRLQPGRIVLFYENGIPDTFLQPHPHRRPSKDGFEALFVGRLVPYKCPDLVLEAVALLRDRGDSSTTVRIVGDGPERPRLEGLTDRLGLRGRVTFTGWLRHADLPAVYRQADLLCFPSIREFGGAVVLEALGAGLPCIVANVGAMADYVTDDVGFRLEPTSKPDLVQTLADRLELLCRDRDLHERMSCQAIERAARFTWARKAADLLDLYAAAIEERRAARSEALASS